MPGSLFVSLDGLDGAGKSTQCRLLAGWLRARGLTVVECKDPGGTSIGEEIRNLLLHRPHELSPACEALLFMASRAELVAQVIRPALDAGQTVVADRFLLANVVYQGHAAGLNPDHLWQMGRLATGGLEPDLTLVLDMPIDACQHRRSRPADRVESRAADFHERVRAGFLTEASRQPERIRVIDASLSVEAVYAMICREVAGFLGARGGPPRQPGERGP